MPVYDLFSKRDQPLPDVFQTETIPHGFRIQVQWILKDTILSHNYASHPFWGDMHSALCREHKQVCLTDTHLSPAEDVMAALHHSSNAGLVLDIIECSFRTILVMARELLAVPDTARRAVEELNHRFRENGIGYQFDINAQRLIPINSTFAHEEVVRPALALLAHADFVNANKEFLEAWDDFKKSDFDDCLVKCGSCFESVMKIICDKKGWTPAGKTAQPLVNCIVDNCGLPPFFKQPLILIAEVRNNLSRAHGAGPTPRNPPIHIARYALNATASAILLLVEATGV